MSLPPTLFDTVTYGAGLSPTEALLDPLATVELILRNAEKFRPEFGKWLVRNWQLWRVFARQADRLWMGGRRHHSARDICAWMRHETAVSGDDGFKINNNYSPDFSRLYVLMRPNRDELFETRERCALAA